MADLTPSEERLLEVWLRLAALTPAQLRQLAEWAKADREYRAAMS
ncbi:MAG TPA: hypothetical protein VIV12_28540 [Streptosporangiaceae bacterium]